MSLRRYAPLKPSRGTIIPPQLRIDVFLRDYGCVGEKIGWPGPHVTRLELDHVRASGGMGMKSPSTMDNLVTLCARCHLWKTEHGRQARPQLLAYLEGVA